MNETKEEPIKPKPLGKLSLFRKFTSILPHHCSYCGKTYRRVCGTSTNLLNPIGPSGWFCPDGHEGRTKQFCGYYTEVIDYDYVKNPPIQDATT